MLATSFSGAGRRFQPYKIAAYIPAKFTECTDKPHLDQSHLGLTPSAHGPQFLPGGHCRCACFQLRYSCGRVWLWTNIPAWPHVHGSAWTHAGLCLTLVPPTWPDPEPPPGLSPSSYLSPWRCSVPGFEAAPLRPANPVPDWRGSLPRPKLLSELLTRRASGLSRGHLRFPISPPQ